YFLDEALQGFDQVNGWFEYHSYLMMGSTELSDANTPAKSVLCVVHQRQTTSILLLLTVNIT
ncbi:hypothetical protein PJP14_30050, partial [Mycobacterium kansasii]